MTDKTAYKLSLTEVFSGIQIVIIIIWYFFLANISRIDSFTVLPFQIFGWLTSIIILIFATIKLKQQSKIGHKILKLIIAILPIIFFYSIDRIADRFAYQYRFVITNNSNIDIDRLVIFNQDSVNIEKFKNNQKIKTELNCSEGMSLYMVSYYNKKIDTTYFPTSGTNSIGYKYICKYKLENDKIKIEIEND